MGSPVHRGLNRRQNYLGTRNTFVRKDCSLQSTYRTIVREWVLLLFVRTSKRLTPFSLVENVTDVQGQARVIIFRMKREFLWILAQQKTSCSPTTDASFVGIFVPFKNSPRSTVFQVSTLLTKKYFLDHLTKIQSAANHNVQSTKRTHT